MPIPHGSRRRLSVLAGVCLAALAGPVGAAAAADDTPAIVEAARDGSMPRVRAVLRAADAPELTVRQTEPDGATALLWASYHDDVEMAHLLLAAGADVDAANDLGATPLWAAAENGGVAMTRLLLTYRADPDRALIAGETPLMVAARAGHADVVDLLAGAGADLNARGTRGQTALMWAASQQQPSAVATLLARGADVHLRSDEWTQVMAVPPHAFPGHNRDVPHGGNTALLFAARSGDAGSTRHLIAAGADVDDANAWGVSAVTMAAHAGHPGVVDALLDAGADPNADEAGFAALHAAVLRRDPHLTRALLVHGADPDLRLRTWTPKRRASADHNFAPALVGATPFWLAARFAEPDLMRLLAQYGADPTFVHDVEYQQDYRRGEAARPHEATNAVMAATGMGGDVGRAWIRPHRLEPSAAVTETVATAVALGADVDLAGPDGNTALHTAAMYGYDDVIQLLVDRGARLDRENGAGETPRVVAERRGRGGLTVELLTALESSLTP